MRCPPNGGMLTIVELIGATKTKTGLKVFAEWDQGSYPAGITVTDAELAAVPVEPHQWHGEWNYTIPVKPPPRPRRSNN